MRPTDAPILVIVAMVAASVALLYQQDLHDRHVANDRADLERPRVDMIAPPVQSAASMAAPTSTVHVTAAFSPGDGGDTAERLVIAAVDGARNELLVAAYEFTSEPIADAVIKAKRRGVDVRIVMDRSQQRDRYGEASSFFEAGIPVRIDYVPAILHDKFMVIDGSRVETGSFNFTKAAMLRNAENALLISDPQVASQFRVEWQRLWSEATPYKTAIG